MSEHWRRAVAVVIAPGLWTDVRASVRVGWDHFRGVPLQPGMVVWSRQRLEAAQPGTKVRAANDKVMSLREDGTWDDMPEGCRPSGGPILPAKVLSVPDGRQQ